MEPGDLLGMFLVQSDQVYFTESTNAQTRVYQYPGEIGRFTTTSLDAVWTVTASQPLVALEIQPLGKAVERRN